jgi:hypothetical protein
VHLTLAPAGSSTDPDRLDVTMRLGGLGAVAGEAFLDSHIVVAGEPGPALGDGDVTASDDLGPLALTVRDDPVDVTGFGQMRRWVPARSSRGVVVVRYSVPVPPPDAPRRSGPPFDVRRENGGFSGAGFGFLVLPQAGGAWDASVAWDLRALPPGSRGVSSLGVGSFQAHVPAAALRASFYMAGPLRSHPEGGAGGAAFSGWWLGSSLFDMAEVMRWAEEAHAALKDFFGDSTAAPFLMLARQGSIPTSGGAALTNSFMIGWGTEAETASDIQFLLAHELAHHWLLGIDGAGGTTSWFSEGLAEFYRIRLPLLTGLVDTETWAVELREMTNKYYDNPHRLIPNDSVAGGFWSDKDIREVPYQRGFLYFADLDGKVRAATSGARSLDDLVHDWLARRSGPEGAGLETWTRIVVEVLGPSARTDLEAMLAGAFLVPPSDVFGPCVERRPVTTERGASGYVWERTQVPAGPACALR